MWRPETSRLSHLIGHVTVTPCGALVMFSHAEQTLTGPAGNRDKPNSNRETTLVLQYLLLGLDSLDHCRLIRIRHNFIDFLQKIELEGRITIEIKG